MPQQEGQFLFRINDFDVDHVERKVQRKASGASVAFYAGPEDEWRSNPANFAMHRNLGSLDAANTASFDAGALAAALAAGMKCR